MYGRKEIRAALDDFILAGCEPVFDNFADLDKATDNSIVWMRETNAEHLWDNPASVVVCRYDHSTEDPDKAYVIVNNPRLAFIKILNYCEPEERRASIDTMAWVHPGAELCEGVSIGTGAVVGDCYIGKGTRIDEKVVIKDGVIIGENCYIEPGAVIGSDGFGYERDKDGKLHKFQSRGGVIIGNNVDIGANTVIDRGTLGDTIIGAGTKIDMMCVIAHNCKIGKDVCIVGCTDISGSVVIEDRAYIAPSVCTTNNIRIGKGAYIGLGAVVNEDVPAGAVWTGYPAQDIRDYKAKQKYLSNFKLRYRRG